MSSDLPKSVGIAHRRALRNHLAKNQIQKDKAVKPTAKPRKPQSPKPDQGLKQTDPIAFNDEAERCFVELIEKTIREDGGPIPINVALQEAAYELHFTISTARNYLLKFTARRAPFMVQDGYVSLRSAK
jgi:hypothetical protein